VTADRHLDWSGCWNARDLGGLPAGDGREIRRAAAVRADALDGLTTAGWAALCDHGVRTVIDLRNDDERGDYVALLPDGLTTIHLPLDAIDDSEFWNEWENGPQFATPLYYRSHIERFPERSAAVLAAIAHARPGGVAFHCFSGRDRTGQIAMIMLALAGVAPSDIAGDYMLSYERLPARHAERGERDPGPLLGAFLADRSTTASDLIIDTLTSLDIEAHMRAGGLTDGDLSALRARLLTPAISANGGLTPRG
jgi:protein-tyrosine phosphatase